ncbi:MAG: dihydroxy-acid dehydratase, partial [Candidatus Omnitrophica bacterium]|nr:dihydroxy-acid dehydratase [Candidatus Omnitrophota bacterium]
IRDGDVVTIDIIKRKLEMKLSRIAIKDRLRQVKPHKIKYTSGVMYKYARNVSSAAKGAVTDL